MWVASSGRAIGLIITNCIKVAGLVIGVKTSTVSEHPDAIVLAFSAFMMAGAQVSETAIMAFFERFFGVEEHKK